jgi:hypothetical protein
MARSGHSRSSTTDSRPLAAVRDDAFCTERAGVSEDGLAVAVEVLGKADFLYGAAFSTAGLLALVPVKAGPAHG